MIVFFIVRQRRSDRFRERSILFPIALGIYGVVLLTNTSKHVSLNVASAVLLIPLEISIDRHYSPGVTKGGLPASSIARSAAVVTVKLRIRPHRRHTICRPGPVAPSAGVHLCLKMTQRTLRLMPPPFSHPYIAHQTTLQAMRWRACGGGGGIEPAKRSAA